MQRAWSDYTNEQLQRMYEDSFPAMNKASQILGPVPTDQEWLALREGRQALEELQRRKCVGY